MAKGGNNVILIGAGVAVVGLAAYKLMRKANAVESLTWNIQSIGIDKARTKLLQLGLNVKVELKNPTNEPLSYNSLYCLINLKGNKLAELEDKTAKMLNPGITVITIPVTISTLATLSTLPNLINSFLDGKNFSETLNLVGHVITGGVTIPLKQSINLKF